ncbi:MAG: hypothetical protein LQ340_001009 [Diploschistes diacapsis]|nr:MAG: hypothetical protein LQ340_001009 [Diploschistes diacapsis]
MLSGKWKLPWWCKLSWRNAKVLPILFIVEFPLTVACLALFGIADPDTYRTSLWQEGANHGWNSDPIEILYAYANYKPIPVPAPWNQFITDWNVVICVLSMFILLAKVVMYITHIFPPVLSVIIHTVLMIFYAVSISQQAASDYSDPDHPSAVPWYLTRGCGAPVSPKLQSSCQQAKASFSVACLMTALFFAYSSFSIYSAIPTKAQKTEATVQGEEDIESPTSYFDDKKWEYEMDRIPQTPRSPAFGRTPMTPRTVAFNTLEGKMPSKPNRDLPLRHHISMGTETYKGRFV